jgi:hypothetical protein
MGALCWERCRAQNGGEKGPGYPRHPHLCRPSLPVPAKNSEENRQG